MPGVSYTIMPMPLGGGTPLVILDGYPDNLVGVYIDPHTTVTGVVVSSAIDRTRDSDRLLALNVLHYDNREIIGFTLR